MNIHRKNAQTVQNNLLVDYWKESHVSEQLIETYEGQTMMSNVTQQKYLGVILSNDGSNKHNIIERSNRAIGVRKEIQELIKGQGKYTFEGG